MSQNTIRGCICWKKYPPPLWRWRGADMIDAVWQGSMKKGREKGGMKEKGRQWIEISKIEWVKCKQN
jgi:hypothetical protein